MLSDRERQQLQAWDRHALELARQRAEKHALDDIVRRVQRAWQAYSRWRDKHDRKGKMTMWERIQAYGREIGEL